MAVHTMLPSWLYAYDHRCNMHVMQLNTDKPQHPRVYSNARAPCRISSHPPPPPPPPPSNLQEMNHTARSAVHYAGSSNRTDGVHIL